MPLRFQVESDFYDHPKTINLSDAAVALWVKAGSYSIAKLLDGFVPEDALALLSKSPAVASDELVRRGFWRKARGGYQFHQWDDRNLTRGQVATHRAKDRDRKKNARKGTDGGLENSIGEPSGGVENQAGNSSAATTSDGSSQVAGQNVRADKSRNPGRCPHGVHRLKCSEVKCSEVTLKEPGAVAPVVSRPDVDEICRRLADRIIGNGCKAPEISKKWRDAARLMLDRDNRPPEEIARLIDWCQDDGFWRTNVMSMPTFRRQYDRLRMQSAQAPSGVQKPSTTDHRAKAARDLGREMQQRAESAALTQPKRAEIESS